MATIREIEDRLRQFVADTEGVIGVVISTPEGLTYAYYSDRAFDPDLVSAIIASMFALARKSGRTAGMGSAKEINVHELVLGVETLPGVMTGMVIMSARKMLKELEGIANEVS